MPEFFIPPKEISFRLKNKSTEQVLFSREKKPNFGQFKGDTFADQWWHLEAGTGDREGWYLVKSNFTGKILFSRTKSPPVDHYGGNGEYADQWFKLEPGSGDRANWFRLRNTSSNTVVVSGDGVTNSKADDGEKDNQFWCFEFEDMKFVNIEYHEDQKKIFSQTPEVIGKTTLTNVDSDISQQSKLTIKKEYAVTSIMEYTAGFSIKIGASVTSGPPLMQASGSIEVTGSFEHKWGENTTNTVGFIGEVPLAASTGTRVHASVTATRSELEVPFTILWKSAKTGYGIKTQGVYKGTTFWNLDTRVDKEDAYDAKTDKENRELEDGEEGEDGEEEMPAESTWAAEEDEEPGFVEEDHDGYEEPAPEDEGDYQGRDEQQERQDPYAEEEIQEDQYVGEDEVSEQNEFEEANGEYPQVNDYAQEEQEGREQPEPEPKKQDDEPQVYREEPQYEEEVEQPEDQPEEYSQEGQYEEGPEHRTDEGQEYGEEPRYEQDQTAFEEEGGYGRSNSGETWQEEGTDRYESQEDAAAADEPVREDGYAQGYRRSQW